MERLKEGGGGGEGRKSFPFPTPSFFVLLSPQLLCEQNAENPVLCSTETLATQARQQRMYSFRHVVLGLYIVSVCEHVK